MNKKTNIKLLKEGRYEHWWYFDYREALLLILDNFKKGRIFNTYIIDFFLYLYRGYFYSIQRKQIVFCKEKICEVFIQNKSNTALFKYLNSFGIDTKNLVIITNDDYNSVDNIISYLKIKKYPLVFMVVEDDLELKHFVDLDELYKSSKSLVIPISTLDLCELMNDREDDPISFDESLMETVDEIIISDQEDHG